MNDIQFDSKYLDIKQEEQRVESIRKHWDSKPMNSTEWLAHLLWREYSNAMYLQLPNFSLVDNSEECINLIIKQLEDIKQNKELSREFVHQYFYNGLWGKTLVKLERFEELCDVREFEYNILRKLYSNKKTLKVLDYICNLNYVYCKQDNKVFSVEDREYIKPEDDHKGFTKKQYEMYYGGYEKSKEANKSKIRRAINYLIDNEPELLEHLDFYINEKGNLTDKGLKQINYYDVCKKIQDFLLNGSKLNPNIEYTVEKYIVENNQ